MRIVLDGLPLSEPLTGVGTYTLELARALSVARPDDNIQLVSPKPYLELDLCPAANLSAIHVKSNPITRRWWSIGLPSYVRRNSVALFHGTNFELPLTGEAATVVTIHDLSLLRHCNMHTRRAVWRSRLRLPLMLRKATMVITPSQAVRHEVLEYLKMSDDKVVAVPLGVSGAFTPMDCAEAFPILRRLKVEDEFLLFVGTVEPRKNLLSLIKAFEGLIRNTELRPQLVIAGKVGWKTREFLSYVNNSELKDRITITGYRSAEDLRALYSTCAVFIYPSIYEGFGLPPLEAMACGAPVIASRVPSVDEKVACLVSPTDVEEITSAMVQLLSNSSAREKLSIAGREHAAKFTWERTAEMTSAVYDEALRRKSK